MLFLISVIPLLRSSNYEKGEEQANADDLTKHVDSSYLLIDAYIISLIKKFPD